MLNLTSTQKQIILGIKITIFALISWFFLYQLFYVRWSKSFLILTVLGLLFWGVSICLGALLVEKKAILYSGVGLSLVSFFIFFHGAEMGPGQFRVAFYYFVVMILIFLSFLIYRKRVQHERKMRVKIYFWRIFKRGLPLVFTMICLLIALAYYFSPFLGEFSANTQFQISRNLFDNLIKPFEGLIQSRLPVDTIKDENLNDTLYELINSQTKINNSFGEYIPIVLAIGLFLSLRILIIILIPVIALFSYIITKILISMGFIKIISKSIRAEKIEI